MYSTDYFDQLFAEKVRSRFSNAKHFYTKCLDQVSKSDGSGYLFKLEGEYTDGVIKLNQEIDKMHSKCLRELEDKRFTSQKEYVSYCHSILDGRVESFLQYYSDELKEKLQRTVVHYLSMTGKF
ncbi:MULTISPECIES: hypothetical protein [Enterococcus]|uniref:Uncharacterized protein n=1 Tax=Enterococcus faecium TaxID=1352 RepID=A0A0D5MBF3_ENTFC|nr:MULTISPECIES: hypothetical protein [Enterococcus]AJY53605.1 hypothetical protein pEfm12493_121 [Enterococcus faecium]MEC3942691.1 hypothetical protein [Enterococcus mundtii]